MKGKTDQLETQINLYLAGQTIPDDPANFISLGWYCSREAAEERCFDEHCFVAEVDARRWFPMRGESLRDAARSGA